MFCRDAIHFVPPWPRSLVCFHQGSRQQILLLRQQPKSRQPVFQAQIQSATRAEKCSGPSLLLLLRRATELGWLCQSPARVHLSSTPPPTLGYGVSAPAQLTADWGLKIVFIFHLRLIHPIQRARSSEMNVHRERDLWFAACFPPNLSGCSASCFQILPLLLRVFTWNLISCVWTQQAAECDKAPTAELIKRKR